jgi:hypothetical protein
MNIQGEIIDGVFKGGVFSTHQEAEAFVHEAVPGIEVMAASKGVESPLGRE